MNTACNTQRERQRGLSLVEILISLTLSLVVLGVIGQIYVGSKQTYRTTDALSRLQENGRFAIDTLARDVREAGYSNCGGRQARVANSVNGGTSWIYDTDAIQGFEGGVQAFPFVDSSLVESSFGSDGLIVRHADTDDGWYVSSHVPASAVIHFPGAVANGPQVGEILVIANKDCSQIGIFQMSGPNNSAPNHVVHNSGGSTSPGNCTKALWTAFDCSDPPDQNQIASDWAYESGSTLFRFVSNAYYVGWESAAARAAGQPSSLVRVRLGGTGGAVTEALVEGVESMQIEYGVNSDKDIERTADVYVKANNVALWEDVVSVRLSLLLRSREDNVRAAVDSGTYTLLGTSLNPTDDHRIRRQFTTSMTLRNFVP